MDNDGRGYQPESAPKTVLQFIQQKYPQANIVEIDQDKGLLKIDIIDQQIMKEVVFNHQNQWVVTTWEVSHNNVPTNVMNVLKLLPTQITGLTTLIMKKEQTVRSFTFLKLNKGIGNSMSR